MTITVVQSASAGSQASTTFAGSFAGNVTAGNTVLLSVTTFSASNVVISTSAPTLGGSAVTGASKLKEIQSAYSGTLTAYAAIWLLPNAVGGSASFGITVTNGTTGNAQTGLMAWEVSGLGSSPALDASSSSSGASNNATSGTTGATAHAAELVLGVLMATDGLSPSPGSPAGYTNITIGGTNTASEGGYQIQSVSGSTYTYANFNGGTDPWAGVIVTVYAPAGTAHSDTAALTLSDTRTNTQVHGHNPAAALTVSPGRANVVAYGKNPKLVLAPVLTAVPSGGSQRKGGPDRHRWWKP